MNISSVKKYEDGDVYVQLGYCLNDQRYYIRTGRDQEWKVVTKLYQYNQDGQIIDNEQDYDQDQNAFKKFDIICKYQKDKAERESEQYPINEQVTRFNNFKKAYKNILLQYKL